MHSYTYLAKSFEQRGKARSLASTSWYRISMANRWDSEQEVVFPGVSNVSDIDRQGSPGEYKVQAQCTAKKARQGLHIAKRGSFMHLNVHSIRH